ncbi:MAG: hypothetical protein ACPHN2_08820 [Sinimarinibacterium flocculans]|uniref:hypothetical protein n=1 Tax=Sinimarinibacterium flocculans TaxID=985250 RepID=UPI003C33AEB3
MNVSITPGCVIRPGDTVIVSSEQFHSLDVLREGIAERLPANAKLVLIAGDRIGVLNLTRLLEQHLDQLRNERACRCDRHPLNPGHRSSDDSSEQRVVEDERPIALEVPRSPVMCSKPFPHGRRSK